MEFARSKLGITLGKAQVGVLCFHLESGAYLHKPIRRFQSEGREEQSPHSRSGAHLQAGAAIPIVSLAWLCVGSIWLFAACPT